MYNYESFTFSQSGLHNRGGLIATCIARQFIEQFELFLSLRSRFLLLKYELSSHRCSIRLKGYDYSQAGAYFITACCQNHECLFGEIEDGKMRLNAAGLMVLHWYNELENKFTGVQCDEFICMSNHIHFIVNIVHPNPNTEITVNQSIVGADPCVRPDNVRQKT